MLADFIYAFFTEGADEKAKDEFDQCLEELDSDEPIVDRAKEERREIAKEAGVLQ